MAGRTRKQADRKVGENIFGCNFLDFFYIFGGACIFSGTSIYLLYFSSMVFCILFYKRIQNRSTPKTGKSYFLYKTSFIYKFFYVNRTYENGSKKQIAFKQYRIMFYFHLLFAFIAFSPVIKEPLNFEEKNFSINGYIKEVKKISTLSGCGQVILTIMNEKGHKIEIYSNNKYDNIIKLDKNSLYVFEIDYSKNSPIWICRRHDHLYSMKKDGNYIISHNKELRKRANNFMISIGFFFIFVGSLFLTPIWLSYEERNKSQ